VLKPWHEKLDDTKVHLALTTILSYHSHMGASHFWPRYDFPLLLFPVVS
jgi:hypothetical protein